MEKQISAVEWLVEKLDQNFDYVADTIIEQAKQIEKEQIQYAFNFGVCDGGGIIKKYKMSGEQYYNETFKSE